jgi:hypothetical protein
MSSHPRPVLLGYMRADLLRCEAEVRRAQAALAAFTEREGFGLGTVYVESSTTPGSFDTLLNELARDELVWGVVVPDLRHVTGPEQQVMRSRDDGARTPIVVANFSPRAGGPGAGPPACAGSASPSP